MASRITTELYSSYSPDCTPRIIKNEITRVQEQLTYLYSCLHFISDRQLNRFQLRNVIDKIGDDSDVLETIKSLNLYGDEELPSRDEIDQMLQKTEGTLAEMERLLKKFPYNNAATSQQLTSIRSLLSEVHAIVNRMRTSSEIRATDLNLLHALIPKLTSCFKEILDAAPEQQLVKKIEEFLQPFEKTGTHNCSILQKRNLLEKIRILFERCKEIQGLQDMLEVRFSPLSSVQERLRSAQGIIQTTSTRF